MVEELKFKKELDLVGGPYFVTRLTNAVVSSANIEAHSRIILQKFIQRELIRISGALHTLGWPALEVILRDKRFRNFLTPVFLRKNLKHIAIGSIVEIDGQRSLEPVKYSEGSGFWRIFMAPMVSGRTFLSRVVKSIFAFVKSPVDYLRAFFVDDWSKRTQILLYMESIDSSLSFKSNGVGGLKTALDTGEAPTAFNPKAQEIAGRVEKRSLRNPRKRGKSSIVHAENDGSSR